MLWNPFAWSNSRGLQDVVCTMKRANCELKAEVDELSKLRKCVPCMIMSVTVITVYLYYDSFLQYNVSDTFFNLPQKLERFSIV